MNEQIKKDGIATYLGKSSNLPSVQSCHLNKELFVCFQFLIAISPLEELWADMEAFLQ